MPYNKCVVCTKLKLSQLLTNLGGRKRVVGYAPLPEYSIPHVC